MVWEEAIADPDQTPAEAARKIRVDNSYISYVLKRTTEEDLEEYKKKREDHAQEVVESPADEEMYRGDTHIYIFSDMSAEEIRDFLKV